MQRIPEISIFPDYHSLPPTISSHYFLLFPAIYLIIHATTIDGCPSCVSFRTLLIAFRRMHFKQTHTLLSVLCHSLHVGTRKVPTSFRSIWRESIETVKRFTSTQINLKVLFNSMRALPVLCAFKLERKCAAIGCTYDCCNSRKLGDGLIRCYWTLDRMILLQMDCFIVLNR